MTDIERKIYMTEEQFDSLKAIEMDRTRQLVSRIEEQTGILKAQESRKDDDLRNMFAGQALSGQLANRYQDQWSYQEHAKRAFDQADAMIAAKATA